KRRNIPAEGLVRASPLCRARTQAAVPARHSRRACSRARRDSAREIALRQPAVSWPAHIVTFHVLLVHDLCKRRCVVASFGSNTQRWRALWCVDLDSDFSPPAVIGAI